MLIAVVSDLHDNVAAWNILLREFANRGITTIINCGDTCAPAMLQEMASSFPGKIHTVFGNVADRKQEEEIVKDLPNVVHYGDQGEVTLDGKHIYFNHFPKNADTKAASGDFDLVCHGHTHFKRWEPFDKLKAEKGETTTWILNPGTAAGMFQYPSFAIVNLQTLEHEFIDLTI